MKIAVLITTLIAAASFMILTPLKSSENCMQKYSTVALVNTDNHPNVISTWRTAMSKQGRVISEYNDKHKKYYIIKLRAKGASTSSRETDEKVYIFAQQFDVNIIQDTCEYPITKILTFSRDIPNELRDITTDTAQIKDITNEH